MSRLDASTLVALPPGVARPRYDRSRLQTGIVHFGPGAFHRAHQAAYVDRLLHDDPRWGIAAVSLRSGSANASLAAQDGLYTLMLADREPSFRIIGAHTAFFGPADLHAVRGQLSSPKVRLVTTTVTEKGYSLAADGTLDFSHPDIANDLATPEVPRSIIGWLALSLADRRRAAQPAFTTLCCDNLAGNGRKLGGAVAAFAEQLDPGLADWIRGEAAFPDSMVDSITPATDHATRVAVEGALGVADAVPVRREPYAAWVIEDRLPAGTPDLAAVGARITSDVAAWERAKLRILNGAHSTLAYLGLLGGCSTVGEAAVHPTIGGFVRAMVATEVIPTLPAAFDLDAYAAEIFDRFANPATGHQLEQIAIDGSQKLPYRLLDTINAFGACPPRLTIAVAAWMAFVSQRSRAGIALADPLAVPLATAGTSADPVGALLALRQIFPAPLAERADFRAGLDAAFERFMTSGVDWLETIYG